MKDSTTLDIQDKDGWTALHYAAAAGNAPAVFSLAVAKANTFITNNEGETPIDVATVLGIDAVARPSTYI